VQRPAASPSGVPLSSITVTVYNGTSTSGLAANATAVLDAQGVKATVGGNAAANPTTGAKATPTPSISAESRSGDENICSNLPTPVKYGGAP
jgi:hypothetical protein